MKPENIIPAALVLKPKLRMQIIMSLLSICILIIMLYIVPTLLYYFISKYLFNEATFILGITLVFISLVVYIIPFLFAVFFVDGIIRGAEFSIHHFYTDKIIAQPILPFLKQRIYYFNTIVKIEKDTIKSTSLTIHFNKHRIVSLSSMQDRFSEVEPFLQTHISNYPSLTV